ncbi:MAG: PD-(D/E)XK nuclease family protein [Bacteroidia bacterium]|nr:PD-(D/E)XK nuclease family protein [Bacteroidia bacterium]MDW8157647.1 PD-(D/E)XK nuclease family protein [Bacteroidia bacterium]
MGQIYKVPLWAPATYNLDSWLAQLTDNLIITDELTLIIELYEIYRQICPEDLDNFETFYPFGKILLQDFENIDISLANPQKVFQNLKEIQELDEQVSLDQEVIQNFWQAFKGIQPLEKKFAQIWKILDQLYFLFQQKLISQKRTYYSLALKELALQLMNPAQREIILTSIVQKGWLKLYFIGFYPLGRALQQIITLLEEAGIAESFWDADVYYTQVAYQEAGLGFRKFPVPSQAQQFCNILSNSPKEIEVIGAPLRVTQSQIVGQALSQHWQNYNLEEIAIIVLDPHFLFPVLNSLPEGIGKINISLQIPLYITPAYNFLQVFVSMHQKQQQVDRAEFYYQYVCSLLSHPLLPQSQTLPVQQLIQKIYQENWVWVPNSMLAFEDPLLRLLFQKPGSVLELYIQMKAIVQELLSEYSQADVQESDSQRIQTEILYSFYTLLNRIANLYDEKIYPNQTLPVALQQGNFAKIFEQVVSQTQMSFTGEPLTGLQILDLSQTYSLDFKYVIFVGMNEGIFPPSISPTFIPLNLKKGYHLLLPEDQTSKWAYLFYRILQRAEKIQFFYNSDPDENKVAGMEKSRYLLQVQYEWVAQNPNLKVIETLSTPQVPLFTIHPLTIPKTPSILERLHNLYFCKDNVTPLKAISPSAINTYLRCKLQFYLSYVLELSPLESIQEELESSTIGNILHAVLERLFPLEKPITLELLAALKKRIEEIISQVYAEGVDSKRQIYAEHGYNYLMQQALKDIIEKIINHEEKRVKELEESSKVYTIWAKEKQISTPLALNDEQILLKGKIDRIDIVDNQFLILDYKSGQLSRLKKIQPQDWDKIFCTQNPKPEVLQGLFYAYLLYKDLPASDYKPVQLGIYSLRAKPHEQGLLYLFNKSPIEQETLQTFEQKLITLLQEIFFNPEINFSQTSNKNFCQYCTYQKICLRDL